MLYTCLSLTVALLLVCRFQHLGSPWCEATLLAAGTVVEDALLHGSGDLPTSTRGASTQERWGYVVARGFRSNVAGFSFGKGPLAGDPHSSGLHCSPVLSTLSTEL